MKVFIKIVIWGLVVQASFASCENESLLVASLDFAGKNRKSLENVLFHYKDDPVKLESAKFIISNLPHWFSYKDSGELDSIEHLLHMVSITEDLWYFKDISSKDWNNFDYLQFPRRYDCHVITDSLLISNIDHAYEQRLARRWNKEITDDDFNNYVLPHRIGDEKLSNWRELYLQHYGQLLDSIDPNCDDSLKAAEIICTELDKENFKYNICTTWPHRKAVDLFVSHAGPCRDKCDHAIYALRSVGIPCAIDTYFTSPETDTSHQWVVVKDNVTGHFIPLSQNMVAKRDSSINDWRKKGKVYRYMPSFQREHHNQITQTKRVKTGICNYFIKDVTNEYFQDNIISVPIYNPNKNQVMLGVFSPKSWKVIDYAFLFSQDKVSFKNIEPSAIYIPLIELKKTGTTKPCGFPFIVERDLSVTVLSPSTEMVSMTLNRKMPLMPWLCEWFSKGVGKGYFELSTSPKFSSSIKGKLFPDTLRSNFHLSLFPPTETRFIKLSVPGNDPIVIGEIEVYSDSAATCKLECKIDTEFGSNFHPENATDGDLLSFFAMPSNQRSVTLKLAEKAKVEAVGFIPRNNDNFIWPGEMYQLLYFESADKGWVEIDNTIASERFLQFVAPANALYWLRNVTKGHEEQAFIWRDGKQVFAHDL